jgi:hypothetical protein
MPQIFCGRSSPIPYSKGRSRLANTTRAPADLPVSCTWTVIPAPNSRRPEVFTKAPCWFTTIVSPSHVKPVACTSMRTRIGTRVLRRSSLRRSGLVVTGLSQDTSSCPIGLICSAALLDSISDRIKAPSTPMRPTEPLLGTSCRLPGAALEFPDQTRARKNLLHDQERT